MIHHDEYTLNNLILYITHADEETRAFIGVSPNEVHWSVEGVYFHKRFVLAPSLVRPPNIYISPLYAKLQLAATASGIGEHSIVLMRFSFTSFWHEPLNNPTNNM